MKRIAGWALGVMFIGGSLGAAELQVGDEAPDFELQGTDGKSYRLSEIRGKAPRSSYFNIGADRKPAGRFVRALLEKQLAVEDARAIFPGGARAVHITQKALYRALGIPDVRHRRGQAATTQVLMRRLLALDYVIERPTLDWLPTEAAKVQRFEALGLDRGVLPYRTYGEGAPAQKRFVALKCPVAMDEHMVTFTYVDPGLTTDSELRAWGVAHAPVWAALRASHRHPGSCTSLPSCSKSCLLSPSTAAFWPRISTWCCAGRGPSVTSIASSSSSSSVASVSNTF